MYLPIYFKKISKYFKYVLQILFSIVRITYSDSDNHNRDTCLEMDQGQKT